jgi:hypothetical protein
MEPEDVRWKMDAIGTQQMANLASQKLSGLWSISYLVVFSSISQTEGAICYLSMFPQEVSVKM